MIRFPNGQIAGRDRLRAALTGRTEPEALGATVSTKIPPGAPPSIPYVLVRTDDAGEDARLNGYAVLRVTVWHRDEGLALSLAGLCASLLRAETSAASPIRSVGRPTGPIPTTDPDSGTPTAFFRVTARLRPDNL
jgi:hypothetical protein